MSLKIPSVQIAPNISTRASPRFSFEIPFPERVEVVAYLDFDGSPLLRRKAWNEDLARVFNANRDLYRDRADVTDGHTTVGTCEKLRAWGPPNVLGVEFHGTLDLRAVRAFEERLVRLVPLLGIDAPGRGKYRPAALLADELINAEKLMVLGFLLEAVPAEDAPAL